MTQCQSKNIIANKNDQASMHEIKMSFSTPLFSTKIKLRLTSCVAMVKRKEIAKKINEIGVDDL